MYVSSQDIPGVIKDLPLTPTPKLICRKLSLRSKASVYFVNFPMLPASCFLPFHLLSTTSTSYSTLPSVFLVGFVVGFCSNLGRFCRQDLISQVEGVSLLLLSFHFYFFHFPKVWGFDGFNVSSNVWLI